MATFTAQGLRATVLATTLMLLLPGCGGGGDGDGGGNGSGNKCPVNCSAAADCDGFSFFVECTPTADSTVRDQFSYDAFGNVISHTRSGVLYEENGTPHPFTAGFTRGGFVGGRATTCSLHLAVEGIGTCDDAVQ